MDLSVTVFQVRKVGLGYMRHSDERFSNRKLERTLIGGLRAELEF